MTTHDETIAARCPICKAHVPMFTVHINTNGRWRKHVTLTVEGDATDYVAHMWTHTNGAHKPAP